MLEEGTYAMRLKKRIRGGMGHLSNTQALELFIKHKPQYMSHLVLSHLSKNNNRPELVLNLFEKHAGSSPIVVASRYKESAIYKIAKTIEQPPVKQLPLRKKSVQMSLF